MRAVSLSVCIRLLLAALLLAGCSARPEPVSQDPDLRWPTAGWQTASPESQGMDPALLNQMQDHIKATGLQLDSLLIIRGGRIVSETYYRGSRSNEQHVQYSVTKSFVATLAGIALDQGKLTLDQKLVERFPGRTFANPDPRKDSITIEHVLTMTPGLDWYEGDPSYGAVYRNPDWAQWMLNLPQVADPGQSFSYCSGCSHLLTVILQQATGDTLAFADENLFKPLGIRDYRWEKDASGIAIGGWGLYLTPRDMAKLGYLYLHDGRWEGRQLVSASWVRAATTRHTSTDGNLGYGYQWWTYPTHDAYTALGRAGQTIFVAPGLDLIVVTTANLSGDHDPIFQLLDDYILPAANPIDARLPSANPAAALTPAGPALPEQIGSPKLLLFYSPL